LRDGLSYLIGPVDSHLLALCATDTSIEIDLASDSKYVMPYHIYLHYIYMKNHQYKTASHLVKKLGEARSVESTAAVMACIRAELNEGKEIPLALSVFTLCFSAVFIQRSGIIKAGNHVTFYIDDKTSFLAAILLKGFTLGRGHVNLDLENIDPIIENGKRGGLNAAITYGGTSSKTIKISNQVIIESFADLFRRSNNRRSEQKKGVNVESTGVSVSFEDDYGYLYTFIYENSLIRKYIKEFPIKLESRALERYVNGLM